MTTKPKLPKSRSLWYYIVRIAQRISLLMTLTIAIAHWAALIAITISEEALYDQVQGSAINAAGADNAKHFYSRAVDTLAYASVRWMVICAVITIGMLCFARVRKYEKRLIVDTAVVLLFTLVSLWFSQDVVRAFVNHLV